MPTLSRTSRRTGRPWFAAVLVGVALVAVSCSNSSGTSSSPTTSGGGGGGGGSTTAVTTDEKVPISGVPGVSDDEIDFAAFGTQSNNPLGTCVLDCYTDGIEAYFAYRNSEGGVKGRQMKLTTVLDDELAKNQEKALEIVSADDTFAAFSATQVPSGWGDIADAGIPLYTWSIHPSEMEGKDSIFGYTGVLCTSCTNKATLYPGKLDGATKVATLGYGISPNSAECARGTADAVREYGGDAGMEVVYVNDEMAFGLPNGVGPEVTAMKDAGVDFIYGCLDLNGMKTIAQELERQGMADVHMYHPNTYDAAFVAEAGDLFEGDIVGVTFRPFEAASSDSQLADFQKWMGETGSEITELAMIGWINADLAYQGLAAAPAEFDRASVIAATNQLTDYNAGGLIAPIDWTRQHQAWSNDDPTTHGPKQNCAAYVKVVDGKFQLVGDSDKPFFCWDTATKGWAEPVATSFG